MEIPQYQPFYLESPDALRAEIARLGLQIPIDDDVAVLTQPLVIGPRTIANRFCAQPITGCDAAEDGSPGELTFRRYRRYAEGGFGLIWFESTIPGAIGEPGRLRLHEDTVGAFRAMVQTVRASARGSSRPDSILSHSSHSSHSAGPTLILQLAFPKFASLEALSETDLAQSRDDLIHAAILAASAGFDGVDIQCSHGSLASALLGASGREGPYGSTFENRSRFLLETLSGIRAQAPELLLAVRLCAFDARRQGFGVSATDYRKPDLAEPLRLAGLLRAAGVSLLNVTSESPNLRGPAADRSLQPLSDADNPHEHPLMTLDRQLRLAQSLRQAAPGLAVVGSGFSWLRQFAPHVAAGAIREGMMDIAGLGRGALAYPEGPAELLAGRGWNPAAACIVCFACSSLRAEGQLVGCVIRDPETYGPIYRSMRRFDSDQLLAGAARCHMCEAAPCIAASPTRTDIPAFLQAFRSGDEAKAYEIIRERDLLPELTARISPAWLESEGACIETTLTGVPIPILDIQYAVSWRARQRGQTAIRIPEQSAGKRIAIIGGGPTGISAAIRLLELGHHVDLYETTDRLGGAPQRVIPQSRVPDIGGEIDSILEAALPKGARASRPHPSETPTGDRPREGTEPGAMMDGKSEKNEKHEDSANGRRLQIVFGFAPENGLYLPGLRTCYDAVLLAVGLWQESPRRKFPISGLRFSVSPGSPVLSSLDFLEEAKLNAVLTVPPRVAILGGGDSAMDAARLAQAHGAKEIFIIFGGPRSALHWHMPESWFATPGVHAMMSWTPLGYEFDSETQGFGVRIRHTKLNQECVLPVDLVIEAMGLEIADSLREALAGLSLDASGRIPVGEGGRTELERVYAAGALVNGGASVGRCVAEGMAAAAAIHSDLMMLAALP